MRYMRKMVIAAVAGAAVSGVVLANRKAIDRLIHVRSRKNQLKKLESWYESQLEEIEEFVGIEADRYLENNRDRLRQIAEQKGYSAERTDVFLQSVHKKARKVIATSQRAQVTKKYGEYLYDFNPKRAHGVQMNTRWLFRQANKRANAMHRQGYPTSSLFVSLRMTPPA